MRTIDELKNTKQHEAGKCPECRGDLNYGTSQPDGESLFYFCDCPKCGWFGKEWYSLSFSGFTGKNNEDM